MTTVIELVSSNWGHSIWGKFCSVCCLVTSSPRRGAQQAINHNHLCFCLRLCSAFPLTPWCWDGLRGPEDQRQHLNSDWGIECALVQTHHWPSDLLFVVEYLLFLLFSPHSGALIKSPGPCGLDHRELYQRFVVVKKHVQRPSGKSGPVVQ